MRTDPQPNLLFPDDKNIVTNLMSPFCGDSDFGYQPISINERVRIMTSYTLNSMT